MPFGRDSEGNANIKQVETINREGNFVKLFLSVKLKPSGANPSTSAKQKKSCFCCRIFLFGGNSNSQEFVIIRGVSRVIIVAQQLIIIRFLKSEFENYNSLLTLAHIIAPFRHIIVRFTLTL